MMDRQESPARVRERVVECGFPSTAGDAPHGLIITSESNLDGGAAVVDNDDVLSRPHRRAREHNETRRRRT